jgi:hypothetical protein
MANAVRTKNGRIMQVGDHVLFAGRVASIDPATGNAVCSVTPALPSIQIVGGSSLTIADYQPTSPTA